MADRQPAFFGIGQPQTVVWGAIGRIFSGISQSRQRGIVIVLLLAAVGFFVLDDGSERSAESDAALVGALDDDQQLRELLDDPHTSAGRSHVSVSSPNHNTDPLTIPLPDPLIVLAVPLNSDADPRITNPLAGSESGHRPARAAGITAHRQTSHAPQIHSSIRFKGSIISVP